MELFRKKSKSTESALPAGAGAASERSRTNGALLTPDLLAEIKRLHFQTKRLADQGVVGRYRSAFRGLGMEFEEVREYFPGDDVRAIDWKVTARSQKPYIKTYREERELTVVVAVDVSASTLAATRGRIRADIVARVGAILTLIALNNNDKVGLVTFSDRIESYHPPRKAKSAVWRILHEVLTPTSANRATDIGGLCRFLSNVLTRRSIIFLVSDFIGESFELPLATLAKRHDVTALVVTDPADAELPKTGMVAVVDPETDERVLIDCADDAVREAYRAEARRAHLHRSSLLRRLGVASVELATDRPFMSEIKRFFDRKAIARRRVMNPAVRGGG